MQCRVVELKKIEGVSKRLIEINVDPFGIKIMKKKGVFHSIVIENIKNQSANLLKQQMLSLGGEVAVSRDVASFKKGNSTAVIFGTVTQIENLIKKLKFQPYGLREISTMLKKSLANFNKNFKRPLIMGIVNLTPDSFSGDGLLNNFSSAINYVEKMVEDGADILDIGGESTSPGSKPIREEEEIKRVIPLIKHISKKIKIPISIDTYKPEVAKVAIDGGASIVNDIWGLRWGKGKMASMVAKRKVKVIIMHMQGNPKIMQKNPVYKNLTSEIFSFFEDRMAFAKSSGIKEEKIIIDPGIGFGKTTEHNLKILNNISEFKTLGCPILIGPSRKSFIGNVLKLPTHERLEGNVASCITGFINGADIFRVHDVKSIVRTLKLTKKILSETYRSET